MRMMTMLAALVWISAVAFYGWTSLPQLPLDVSSSDAATLDALRAARIKHGVAFAAMALLPAAALVWLGRRLTRRA